MVQLTALALNPPTFDPMRATLAGASLLGAQTQNALHALQLGAAQRQHSALEDFGAQGGFGNPAALQALTRDPQLFSGALGGYSAYQTWQNSQTAQAAQRVLAAGPEGSEERARVYRQELGQALAERRIDQNRYTQMLAQDPSDTALQRLIDLARPLTAEPSMEDIMRRPVGPGGGQPPPGGPRPPPSVMMDPLSPSAMSLRHRDIAGISMTPESVGGPPPNALPPPGAPQGGPRVYGWLGSAEAQTPPPGGPQGGGRKGSRDDPYTIDDVRALEGGGQTLPSGSHVTLPDGSVRMLTLGADGNPSWSIVTPPRSGDGPPVTPPAGSDTRSSLGADAAGLGASYTAGQSFRGAPGFAPRWSPDAFAPPPEAGAGVQGGPPGSGIDPSSFLGRMDPAMAQGLLAASTRAGTVAPPGAPPAANAPAPEAVLPSAPGITVGPGGPQSFEPSSLAVDALSGGAAPPPSGRQETVRDAISRILAPSSVTDGQRIRFWTLMSRASTRDDAMKLLQEIESGGVPLTARQRMESEEGLRREFATLASPYFAMRDAFSRIEASVERVSPAGDMALIFNFMKMLDPGSVVREGEFATAQNAAGVPERIHNLYNRLLSGERLNPTQRTDFVDQARRLLGAQRSTYESIQRQIGTIAQRGGLNPDNVLIDFTAPPTAPPSSGQGGAAVRIAGDEEYRALPSGARFIGPDGVERTKP